MALAIGQSVLLTPDLWGRTGVIIAIGYGGFDYGVRPERFQGVPLGFDAHELRAIAPVTDTALVCGAPAGMPS